MEDNSMRKLDNSVLSIVAQKLNPDFIEELPVSLEELFEFAKRRVSPTISDNISYELGKKMLETRLSDEDYFVTFLKAIEHVFSGKSPANGKPTSHVLISQTGAGKTNLRKQLLGNDSNFIIVNSDLYKRFRPDADAIMQSDPTHFGALTGIDCYDHANNILDFATSKGYNLLMECAPSAKEGLIGVDLPKLEEHGYDTNFHVMAVGDLISSLAIHYRYELDIENGRLNQGAKLTDLRRHDESYVAVEEAIRKLPPKKVTIYRRGGEEEGRVPVSLSEAIPSEEVSVATNLRLLKNGRDNSNYEYASRKNPLNFESDYETIRTLMDTRNAPEAQAMQLSEVYNKYINFLGKQYMF